MYICINQDFDTGALMTVSGFVMAVLIFFFNVILTIRKNQVNEKFFIFLVYVSFILFFITIVSIFITIYGNMNIAVIIISLVLFVSSFVIPATFLLSFLTIEIVRENRLQEKLIDYHIDNEFHPNIDDASIAAEQSCGCTDNNRKKPSARFERCFLTFLLVGLPVLFSIVKKHR